MSAKLAAEIARLRKLKEYTQSDVSSQMGLNTTTYAYKEKKGRFSMPEIKKLAKILSAREPELLAMASEADFTPNEALETIIKLSLATNAMLQVLIGSHADVLAKLTGKPKAQVLKELKDGIKARTGQSIDSLE